MCKRNELLSTHTHSPFRKKTKEINCEKCCCCLEDVNNQFMYLQHNASCYNVVNYLINHKSYTFFNVSSSLAIYSFHSFRFIIFFDSLQSIFMFYANGNMLSTLTTSNIITISLFLYVQIQIIYINLIDLD